MLPACRRHSSLSRAPALPDLASSEELTGLHGGTLPKPIRLPPEPSPRSRRVPRELLDVRDNLPKHRTCQVAFGELQGEVPGMLDEASGRLEETLVHSQNVGAPNQQVISRRRGASKLRTPKRRQCRAKPRMGTQPVAVPAATGNCSKEDVTLMLVYHV